MTTLDYAIKMELDGKAYYEEQAKQNKDNRLYRVFSFLAKQEDEHALLLERIKEEKGQYDLKDEKLHTKNLFTDLEDFKSEVSTLARQIEIYRFALDIEEKSIKLYKELYEKEEDENIKKVFAFLVKQEEDHYKMFEELELLVSRPHEWIESAEFGLRDEY